MVKTYLSRGLRPIVARKSVTWRLLLAGAFLMSSAPVAATLIGGVYGGTNSISGNGVAAYGQNANGTLVPIGTFATGGLGGVFDGTNDGLDPLISEDSVITAANRFVLAVNAGSNTITVFRINPDFSLTSIGSASTGGIGPNTIAYSNGTVYVANVDTDGSFSGPPDQVGNITGFHLDINTGALTAIAGSTRSLGSRPSDIEFSPDGQYLVVSSVNAGSSALPSGSTAEVATYGVLASGALSANALGATTSTLPNNASGRNLPTSIGFEIVERNGQQILIVTEAREFQPDGSPGMLSNFQTGSVSTWRIASDGSLVALSQDVLTGPSVSSGPTSACWVVVAPDGQTFWVASASGATISSYKLNADGTINLIDSRAASGAAAVVGAPNPLANADGFIDIAASSDGSFLYQLLGLRGAINVYQVGADGASLTLLQQATGLLPTRNSAGLAFASLAAVPEPATWAMMLLGFGLIGHRVRAMRRGVKSGLQGGGTGLAFAGV